MLRQQVYPRFAATYSRLREDRGSMHEACNSLTAAGFLIMPGTCARIEEGVFLPEDAGRFLATIKRAFDLSESDERHLALRLAHDLIAVELGDWADTLF